MAKKRTPRKPSQAAIGTKQMLGAYWKPDAGGDVILRTVKGGQVTAAGQRMYNAMFNREFTASGEANPNYRPTAENAFGQTPIGTAQHRIGMFDNRTGQFVLNQKAMNATKPHRKNVAGHLKGAQGYGGYTDTLPEAASVASSAQGIYAEGDISRTGTAASQGKAYQYQFGTDAGTVLGATSVPSIAQTEAPSTAEADAGRSGVTKKKGASKKTKKRITAAKKAGNYKKAQAIRSRARKK